MTKKIKLLVLLITLSRAFCLSGCENKTPYIGDGDKEKLNAITCWLRFLNNEHEMHVKGASFIDGIDCWGSAYNRGGVRLDLLVEL